MQENSTNPSRLSVRGKAKKETINPIYLAGPMTGIENYNYDEFHRVAGILRGWGYTVLNPAEHFSGDQSLPHEVYINHAKQVIKHQANGIVLLPGWEKSLGVARELEEAKEKGLPTYAFHDANGYSGPWLERLNQWHDAPEYTAGIDPMDEAPIQAYLNIQAGPNEVVPFQSVNFPIEKKDEEYGGEVPAGFYFTSYGAQADVDTFDAFSPVTPEQIEDYRHVLTTEELREHMIRDGIIQIEDYQSPKFEEFDSGAKRDIQSGRGRYDLLSPHPIRRVAVVYEEGAAHYGERNYEAGMPVARCLSSALRHIFSYMTGDDTEDHLARAYWNIGAMMHMEAEHPELQDLPARAGTRKW